MDCLTPTSWPVLVFFALGVAMMVSVARHNGFGFRDTLKAAVGLRPFRRNGLINLLNAAVLIVPVGLLVWVAQSCPV